MVRELLDVHFPDAEVVRLVMDNLNTHTLGSLTKPSMPRKPGAWRNAWRSTTRPSTRVG